MSAWIGPVGGLVEVLQYKGGLSVATTRPSKSRTTLGGRVKVQRAPRARRVWDASVDGLSPREAAGLLALEAGSMPPWVWADPYAQVTNMLSPEQSVLLPGTWNGTGFVAGGAVVGTDGVTSLRSVAHPTGGGIGFDYRDGVRDSPAVLPGLPATGSVYVRGAGNLQMQFQDWSGAELSLHTAAYNYPSLARASMVRTPPAGAASVHLSVFGALQVAMPAVTWTPAVTEWTTGHGCNRVLVEGLSESIEAASGTDPDGRWQSLKFTVREIG